MRRGTRRFRLAAGMAIVGACLVIVPHIPAFAGHLLVDNDSPTSADLVVVLAGDFYGSRILTAARLVVAGYAPAALISGTETGPVPESELALRFLEDHHFPRSLFIPYSQTASSTIDEAKALLREMRRRRVRKFLLVTSNYHSRRAGLVFRLLCLTCRFRVIAAPELAFRAESWWRTDQGREIFWREFPKLLATPFVVLSSKLIPGVSAATFRAGFSGPSGGTRRSRRGFQDTQPGPLPCGWPRSSGGSSSDRSPRIRSAAACGRTPPAGTIS